MGRFDALTQIEEKSQKPPSSPVAPAPPSETLPDQQDQQKKPISDIKKPANLQTRKPASPQTGEPHKQPSKLKSAEQPEKYSTRLEPSMVKWIKMYAAEKYLKDYEVVKLALTEFFQRQV